MIVGNGLLASLTVDAALGNKRSLGVRHSEETKKRMSKSQKERREIER
jgi:hypothetical protein